MKRPRYLLFVTVFCLYVIKVLDYTLFQFQSLLLLRHVTPGLILRGHEAGEDINLIPLLTLSSQDLETSLLNVLMMVPFGFGLPLITNLDGKRTVLAGVVFSVVIELLQWLSGWMAGITFRIADINDVIFNTVGVAIGCVVFRWVRRATMSLRDIST